MIELLAKLHRTQAHATFSCAYINIARAISIECSITRWFFYCAQILFAEVEMLSAPWGELVYLSSLTCTVRGVSTSPLCVMVYRTVLVAPMK